MKNKNLSVIILILLTGSCVPDCAVNPSSNEAKRYENSPNLVAGLLKDDTNTNPVYNSKAPVTTVLVNGMVTFHSMYGGLDFNFGPSFPYPITVYSYENLTLYKPSFGSISTSPNPLYEFRMGPDGSAFTAMVTTMSGPLGINGQTALKNYYKAFDDFVTQKVDPQTGMPKQPTLPDFSSFAAAASYNPAVNGLLTIKGRFVKDNSSPTNVSIIDMTTLPYEGPV
nr:hypothetical protein [uncultured Dyadobacter sp.]